MKPVSVKANADTVDVTVNVKNTGNVYSGKEVVQVYFSAPDGALEKPYQELAGFAKTDVLVRSCLNGLNLLIGCCSIIFRCFCGKISCYCFLIDLRSII